MTRLTRWGLDHEQHDMGETREPATAAMDQAIPRLAGDIASGGAKEDILFHENLAQGAKFP